MQTNTTDEEVIKKVSEIANTIDACIQSTYDYSSKYEDGRVPMLDLKLRIGENESGEYKVLHTHYMKEVSSRYLIHERSSHPDNMKFTALVNEGILRNCNPNLNWNKGCSHLQHFVHRMQFSGYDHAYRARVITKVLEHYDKKVRKFNETRRMYRSRREQYDERRRKMKRKLCGTIEKNLRLFVDVTENSVMLKEMKKACKRNKLKIKVVEKIDSTVKRELQRSNPFKV